MSAGNPTLLFDGNSLPSTLSDSDRVYARLSLVTFGMGGKKPDKQLVFSSGLVKKSAPVLSGAGARVAALPPDGVGCLPVAEA